LAAERIHGDDTTVPVLAKVKTRTGRIWTYVRDDRPFGGQAPPAAARSGAPAESDVAAKKRRPPKELEQETSTSAARSEVSAARENAPRTEGKAEPARTGDKADHAWFEE
jgi:hypothetical protein